MEQKQYQAYVQILKEELIPAMGCTEPIAVAYAAALAKELLQEMPQRVEIKVSGNIIKNVKSVVVPNTGGMRGLPAAAAAGIVAGDAKKELEVIAQIEEEKQEQVRNCLKQIEFLVEESKSGYVFDIDITLQCGEHSSRCRIAGFHTNVILLQKDGEILKEKPYEEKKESAPTDRSCLSVEGIVAFADEVKTADIEEIIERQISYNMAIAKAGLEGNYGARIGQILLRTYGDTVQNRAKAWAAAGSDARMNGCGLPVVINSGSGNQGMTASIPVVIYAKELNVSREKMLRALVVSNLVTIHLKTGIGRLSAYCGAISAGCGAGAGITYLYGGGCNDISHTIVNTLAIDSGIICDGAKSSCAAKIAAAVEAGLLGMQMYFHGSEFVGGDGIVVRGVENTIKNVGRLASKGMAETDKEIIRMMISRERK